MNVNDPSVVQAAQHISPKPQVFNSTITSHTPYSQTKITTSTYSNNGLPRMVQPNTAAYSPSNSHVAATSYYPMSNFSMPDSFSPVRPPPPPPVMSPRPASVQQQFSQPRPASAASYTQPLSPAPNTIKAKPKNGSHIVGGNRGAQGSHILNLASPNNVPTCNTCHSLVRGPFISAIGKVFCPSHFICQHPSCGVNLENCGFVEEEGKLYCEKDFQQYFAPTCFKCKSTIMGECSYALEKSFHPECFVCVHCKVKLGSGTFHMEEGLPYCPKDFAALFAQKCSGCEFPIEAGDQFFEAVNQLWHCECFTCTTCHVQLKSSGFCVKGLKVYCRKHAL